MQDIEQLIKNKNHRTIAADCVLVAYNGQVSCHKFILMARSPVFLNIIKSKPDLTAISLSTYPLNVLQALVDYLYNDEVSSVSEQVETV